jgi:hypothetical protein
MHCLTFEMPVKFGRVDDVTNDANSLPDEEDDDTTKCVCTICGHAVSVSRTLECEQCGCYFCSTSCARKYLQCYGEIHR